MSHSLRLVISIPLAWENPAADANIKSRLNRMFFMSVVFWMMIIYSCCTGYAHITIYYKISAPKKRYATR